MPWLAVFPAWRIFRGLYQLPQKDLISVLAEKLRTGKPRFYSSNSFIHFHAPSLKLSGEKFAGQRSEALPKAFTVLFDLILFNELLPLRGLANFAFLLCLHSCLRSAIGALPVKHCCEGESSVAVFHISVANPGRSSLATSSLQHFLSCCTVSLLVCLVPECMISSAISHALFVCSFCIFTQISLIMPYSSAFFAVMTCPVSSA